MENKTRITVFTPTYNRGYIIGQLYESLKRQTFTNFEWLIVDDGSVDDTCEIIAHWCKESHPFSIRYERQANGGKCRAINKGLMLAQGELFFTVDSDDYLTDDALYKVNQWFQQLHDDKIVGIVANRGYSVTETENTLFEEEYLDKSLLDIYSFQRCGKKVFDGERAFIFYTDFHRKYLYPEFPNENFMTEAIVWNRMAHDGYLVRYYNDIIWVFAYREDGLTKAGNSVFKRNPHGYGLWLKEKAMFENVGFWGKAKLYYTFSCEMMDVISIHEIADCVGTSNVVIFCCLMLHHLLKFIRGKQV